MITRTVLLIGYKKTLCAYIIFLLAYWFLVTLAAVKYTLNNDALSIISRKRNSSHDFEGNFGTSTLRALKSKQLCPEISPYLIGRLDLTGLHLGNVKDEIIVKVHSDLKHGGRWRPENCTARRKVAIIIPYRNRKTQLNVLIGYLIPILKRQLLDFRFIVAEQDGYALFNKGRVMNAAFLVAEKMGVDCVVFHDVDMFPEDDRILYGCPDTPRHLGAYVNVMKYDLWYDYLLGGVIAFRMDHYRLVNGHSNLFWGWGGEDDDIGKRVLANNLTIDRLPKAYCKYTMVTHIKRQYSAQVEVKRLLNTTEDRWHEDGLNKVQWNVTKIYQKPLYDHVFIDVGQPPDAWTSSLVFVNLAK